MRAATVAEPGKIVIADVPVPEPTADQALVRVEQGGICGTDFKVLDGSIPVGYPRILGHEIVGRVEQAGASGTPAVGARVLVNAGNWCGRCDQCRAGSPNLCRQFTVLGMHVDGGFADYLVVGEHRLHQIPEALDLEQTAVLQVLATVYEAQFRIPARPTDVALVMGLGVAGLLHVGMLRARGVTSIIGIDLFSERFDAASDLGATISGTPEEAAGLVAEATGGRGIDIAVEAAGKQAAIAQAVELAGTGAELLLFGIAAEHAASLNLYHLYDKVLRLSGTKGASPEGYDKAIELAASGAIDTARLFSRAFPLEQAQQAIELAVQDKSILKVTLEP